MDPPTSPISVPHSSPIHPIHSPTIINNKKHNNPSPKSTFKLKIINSFSYNYQQTKTTTIHQQIQIDDKSTSIKIHTNCFNKARIPGRTCSGLTESNGGKSKSHNRGLESSTAEIGTEEVTEAMGEEREEKCDEEEERESEVVR